MNLASEQLAAISRLFSSSVIREMARKGKSSLFARLARKSLLVDSRTERQLVYSLFENAFAFLRARGLPPRVHLQNRPHAENSPRQTFAPDRVDAE